MASNPVHFDGANDFLTRGGGLTGLIDGKVVLFATWFRVTGGTGTDRRIFTIQNPTTSRFFVSVNSSNLLHVTARSPSNALVLDVVGPTAITDSDWHHFIISCNLASAAQRAFYVDGGAVSPTWNTYANSSIDLSPIAADVQVGSFDDTQFFWDGDLADLYFTNPGAWWDPATGGNLAKLIVDGAPPDPFDPDDVTGTAPKVFLGGATATWHVNQGTGGGFTENGALTDGAVPLPSGGTITGSVSFGVVAGTTMADSSDITEAIAAPVELDALAAGSTSSGATIGEMSGGGNVFIDDVIDAPYRITDLAALHCGMARISAASPANGYFQGEAPSPANFDDIIVALLEAGIQPYVSFTFTDHLDSSLTGIPARNYDDWFDIGAAFAARFKAGSAFLTGQGITGLGVYGYSAINEPDVDSGEILPDPPTTFGLTYVQYHDMLEGLADGVHSEEPDGKVWPSGYLSGNRDSEYTGHGYCAAVADLINDGTLEGFDLHTYHSKTGAKIHDTWGRSHQSDVDAFITACGITRQDVEVICTETNVRADPDATAQDYTTVYPTLTNQQIARNWFLTSVFDVWGTLRPDGQIAQGPRFPWNLWQSSAETWWMSSSNAPRVERWTGHTYKMLMDLLWDMIITFSDPRDTGVLKLEGGGKTAWVFQNIHSSWSSLSGSTFTISDIPVGTTRVDVYDGNGLIQTVSTPTLDVPEHTFSTPTGKSYLFVALTEGAGMLSGGVEFGTDIQALSDQTASTITGAQLGTIFQAEVAGDPTERFVSLTGNNGAAGTQEAPWATIAFGLTQVSAGDTLTIRGGTYREAPLSTSVSGAVGNPVTIRSFPGEVATIDAALPEFQEIGNSEWTLFDAATETWRSVGTGYGASSNWRGTFLIDGALYRLWTYDALSHLQSTNYTWDIDGAFYRGPGFCRHTDGRLYIRLQNLQSPRNAAIPSAAPADAEIRNTPPSALGFDPRDYVLNLHTVLDTLTVTGQHTYWSDIAVHGGRDTLSITNNNHTFEWCRFWGGNTLVNPASETHDCQFLKCDFDCGAMPYASWRDAKHTDYGLPIVQTTWVQFEDFNTGWLFEDFRVGSYFDGMVSVGNSGLGVDDDIRLLHGVVENSFDDLMQFGNLATNLEWGWLLLNGSGPGFNGNGTPADLHSKWLHHCIIDCRSPTLGAWLTQPDDNDNWRLANTTLPTHSSDGDCPIKLYNCTFFTGDNIANDGARFERLVGTAGLHEVYKIIVYQRDDREFSRGLTAQAGFRSDFNVFHKAHAGSFPRFNDWPNGAGGRTDYATLAAWKAGAGYTESQAFYAPGYEDSSREIDPQFPAGANIVDQDYRPGNAALLTGGNNLLSTGWPGADATTYIGAVDPDAATGLGDVGPRVVPGPRLEALDQSDSLSFGAQLGTTFLAAVESETSASLSSSSGAWMDFAWMDVAWMGGSSFVASAVDEHIVVGINLGATQAEIAARRGVTTNELRLQFDPAGTTEQIAAATAAASLGATFAAEVNAREAISQAAAFATTQITLAEFPVDFTANVLFDDARVARCALRGAFDAATSHAASQTARAAALGAFSSAASLNDVHAASNAFSGDFSAAVALAAAQVARAAARETVPASVSLDDIEAASPEFTGVFSAATSLVAEQVARAAAIEALSAAATLDDIEAGSNEFAGAFTAAAALDDTQAASVEGAGVVPVSAILASAQVAVSAQMATVIDVAAAAVSITAFSETPTEHVGIVTFELFLPTTQVAEANLDEAASYAVSLAASQTAQAAIDAAVAYAATLASAQADRADLEATVTYPATFVSAETGSSGAGTEIVATTIFDAAQVATAELDAAASYAAELASIQEAQAAIDAAAAYAAALASTQAAEAALDAAASYPAAFSSVEIGISGAALEVVATTIFDSSQIAEADLDGVIAAPIVAGSAEAAIAIRTGAIAAEITAAAAQADNASLDGLVPAAVGFDDIELYGADFSGDVVAAAGMDDFEAFSTDVNDAVAAAAAFAVQLANEADVRDGTIEEASLEILPEGLTESDAVVIVLADFATVVSPAAGISAEMTTGDVQMSVAVVGGAQWLGTYLHAKWPNIGVAA